MRTLKYSEIRLVKYGRLIDKAILQKKYGLATHLAYRCLLEYYRLFLRFRMPSSKYINQNAFQLSVSIVKYLRKYPRISGFKSKHLFSMLSTSYYLTNLSRKKTGDRELHVDLAMATFARENALAISRLIMGSLMNHSEEGS